MSEQSETPRTDEVLRTAAQHPMDNSPTHRILIAPAPELLDLARSLERELSEVTRKRDEAEQQSEQSRLKGNAHFIRQANCFLYQEHGGLNGAKCPALSAAERELDELRGKLELAHEHMQLYLPHYTVGHNVYNALAAATPLRRNEMSKTPITDRNTVGYPQGEFVPVRVAKELESQLSALQADAQRYRWLREHHQTDIKHRLVWYLPRTLPLDEDGLDRTIDAALSVGQQERTADEASNLWFGQQAPEA